VIFRQQEKRHVGGFIRQSMQKISQSIGKDFVYQNQEGSARRIGVLVKIDSTVRRDRMVSIGTAIAELEDMLGIGGNA
jgi:hypothetical protein